MKHICKRLLCLTLCAILALGMVPGRASAEQIRTGSITTKTVPAESSVLPFSDYEYQVLALTNQERMAEGREPLMGFAKLQEACDVRAEEIIESFSHTRPNGTSCFTILEKMDIDHFGAGENIAWGYQDPEDVMQGWMNSPGHRSNILDADFTYLGVGFDSYRWVQMFLGAYGDELLSATVYLPTDVVKGTKIDDMVMYAEVRSSIHGTCYLPLTHEYVTGYDRNKAGTQQIGIEFLGFSGTVPLTVLVDLDAPKVSVGNGTTSGKPRLTWKSVEDAEVYRVYRASSKSGEYRYLDSLKDTGGRCVFTDTSAEAGKKYYYKVRAVTGESYSPYSAVVSRMCDLPAPKVSITGNSSTGKPVVKWETVEGAAKYYIYRATSQNGTYTHVKSAISARSFEDSSTKAGTNYYYKVKAVHSNTGANSAQSEPVNRVCDLRRPVVTITLSTGGNPYLKWTERAGAVEYAVYRSTEKDGTYTLLASTTAEKYIDKDVTEGVTYYYRVKAIHAKSAANSAYSAVKSITAA